MKNKKLISIFYVLCIGSVLLIPSLFLVIMSLTDYRPVSGLLGSSFVGFANIAEFLSQLIFMRVLKNTFTISILALFIGAAYLFTAFLAIGNSRNRMVKAALTIVFALPAIIPVNAYIIILQAILPTEIMMKSSVLLQVIAAAEYGLRYSAVFVIGAMFSKGNILREATKYTFLFVALRLIHILTMDTAFLNSFYNPLTYEHLDTFGSYLYRTGLMQSEFSGYAAGYVVQLLIQLLPAVVGVFLLMILFRDRSSLNSSSGNFLPSIIFAVLPVVLLILALATGTGDGVYFEQPRVIQAYAYGMLIAAASAVVVVGLGMLLARAVVNLGTVGVLLAAVLYFVGDNLLGYYMVGRSLGMLDTFAGVVFQNMYLIAPVGLIGAFMMKEDGSVSRAFTISVSAFGLAFAWFWGDHMSALVALRSAYKTPLSMVIYQLNNRQNTIDHSPDAIQLTATLYVLVPILVAGACIVVSRFIERRK